jgi:hypothetical protein
VVCAPLEESAEGRLVETSIFYDGLGLVGQLGLGG